MKTLLTSRYRARLAQTGQDVANAQGLRGLMFRGADRDADRFDAQCQHLMVETLATGRLIATLRFQVLPTASDLAKTYSAQFYDLSRLGLWPGAMLELGRFCVVPRINDPNILRLVWAFLTQVVDQNQIGLLFGCTSFARADEAVDPAIFDALAQHIGPSVWRPDVTAPECVSLSALGGANAAQGDARALNSQSPLLQGYLGLGGWISDHVVIDRDLGTMLVFTALEVDRIAPSRQRLLRALVKATQQKSPDQ